MATVVACGLAIPATAAADPPSNDDFTAATTISALPYSSQTNTSEATRPVVSVRPDPANIVGDTAFTVYADDSLNRRIVSGELTFGDGTSAPVTGDEIRHRYTEDGVYQLGLTVTTDDGRTGTSTTTLRVETHDVTLSALTAPATARADQTKTITATVTNPHRTETVKVELYKGNIRIGALTQTVPAGATVRFPFAYTFGANDGTVTFRAVATIDYPGDANPTDNTRTATTAVKP